MAMRVTSSRFIGRVAELAELEAALREAADGHPSLAFLAGESGVGKTRLLAELESRAVAGGARVIAGDCVELGEGELPYAPLVAALRPLAREGDDALDDLPASARAELAALVPELGAAAAAAAPDDERGAAQRRLFEALLALLDRLGRATPVLLALEDIHWADRSTRAFLAFLARSLGTERVLAVASYRSDELHRRHPLRPLLAELERDPRARRVELAPLGRDELSDLLAGILGDPPGNDLVDRLYRRSEGNPLFTEELVAAGPAGRGGLPPTLRDALMVRVERLPDPAQEVLRALAAAGRADHALLADATGLEPRAMRDAMREAVEGHIVVVDGEDRYGFRHALLREVVEDDLLPGEQAALHLALARALERRAEPGGAWITAAIAHHYHRAGERPEALRAAVRAAIESERVHAHGEAGALYERALELWERVPDPIALAGMDHVELLTRVAAAHRSNADDGRSETMLERALHELDEVADPRRAAALLGELAQAQWSLGRGDESRATLERALAVVPETAGRERVALLAGQVRLALLQSRYATTIELAGTALEAADAAGARDVRVQVSNGLGFALIEVGEHDRGVAVLREAIEHGTRRDDVATAYTNLADALNLAGHGREAAATVRTGRDDPRIQGRAWQWLLLLDAEIATDLGEWDRAAELLADPRVGGAGPSGSTVVNTNLRRAELALGRGEDAAARPLLDDTEVQLAASIEPQFLGVAGALRAELERRAGDLAAARTAVEDTLDRIEFCSEDLARLARVAAAGAAVEADAALRACDLGDSDGEAHALALLAGLEARVRAACEGERPVERAHLATVVAELTRASGRSDPARWAAARAAWEALERPYPAAIAGWREAEAHVGAGEREAAEAGLAPVLDVAGRLGSAWLVAESEGLAARARLRLERPAATGRDGDQDGEGPDGDPFGLTPRERQVLALLARGATNREIGAELFMAEKTASVHVSRILGKLDVRSRTQAAAVAHRHGMAT
jgi:DNA-binding CsgD family transcriptional regulator